MTTQTTDTTDRSSKTAAGYGAGKRRDPNRCWTCGEAVEAQTEAVTISGWYGSREYLHPGNDVGHPTLHRVRCSPCKVALHAHRLATDPEYARLDEIQRANNESYVRE